jgi:hypothetical protein
VHQIQEKTITHNNKSKHYLNAEGKIQDTANKKPLNTVTVNTDKGESKIKLC